MNEVINILLLLVLVVVAVITLLIRDVLASVIAYSSYSLTMAIVWQRLQAPDLALTEAAVGAGVTTVLFVIVVFKTRGKSK